MKPEIINVKYSESLENIYGNHEAVVSFNEVNRFLESKIRTGKFSYLSQNDV